jgi:hypothetical protein
MNWTREQDIDEVVSTLKAILNELQGLRDDFKAQTECAVCIDPSQLTSDYWARLAAEHG